MSDERIQRQLLATMRTTVELADNLADHQLDLARQMERMANALSDLQELLERAMTR